MILDSPISAKERTEIIPEKRPSTPSNSTERYIVKNLRTAKANNAVNANDPNAYPLFRITFTVRIKWNNLL